MSLPLEQYSSSRLYPFDSHVPPYWISPFLYKQECIFKSFRFIFFSVRNGFFTYKKITSSNRTSFNIYQIFMLRQKKYNHSWANLIKPAINRRLFTYFTGWNNLGWKSKTSVVCSFVWIVEIISAAKCQTSYKKLARIVKPLVKSLALCGKHTDYLCIMWACA